MLVQNSGEFSLAFAVAAQCGVVESVLNKWWSCSSITCSSAQKIHFISSCVPSLSTPVPSGNWHFYVALMLLYFLLFPCLLLLISLQPPPPPNYPTNLIMFLEARQLFADQLALLRRHSYSNAWSVQCAWNWRIIMWAADWYLPSFYRSGKVEEIIFC